MPERFAIYFAPPATSELWQRAAHWLGRDAVTGHVPNAGIPGISGEELTALTPSAARYGFHATLKAPMALAEGVSRETLEAELTAFGLRHGPVTIGRLKPELLDGFLALTPVVQSAELTEFAGKAVAELDALRAPMSAHDREKRLKSNLTPYQIGLMDHYGYPYVMDQFLFHMTLTDRMAEETRGPVVAAAQKWFAPILDDNVLLDRISLFHEAEPGAPFQRVADFPLSTKVRV
jgi:putative phosphonate metabolism protein